MKVNVELLTKTEDPEKAIWASARNCYSDRCACEHWGHLDEMPDDFPRLFNDLYVSGHHSVFRHVQFTFCIEDFSRVAQQQLTRHGFLNWSIQSLRYVKLNGFEHNLHHEIEDLNIFKGDWADDYTLKEQSAEQYNVAIDSGLAPEKARLSTPLGILTNGVMSANLQALIDVAGERRCILAQDEARYIINEIKRIVAGVNPLFGRVMAIKCQRLGYCPESRNKENKICSIRPHVDSLDLNILKVI